MSKQLHSIPDRRQHRYEKRTSQAPKRIEKRLENLEKKQGNKREYPLRVVSSISGQLGEKTSSSPIKIYKIKDKTC